MKSIKKLLLLGMFAAMAAFCLAPGFALAEEGGVNKEINQETFNGTDSYYVITEAGTYNLTEDVTGAIKVTGNLGKVQINLNGHTLTNENENCYSLWLLGSGNSNITIDGKDSDTDKLGSIVQKVEYAEDAESKKAAIRLDSSDVPTYGFKSLEVKSQTSECFDSVGGITTLDSVSVSTSGKANSLIYNNNGSFTINSGNFVKSDTTTAMFEKGTKPILVKGGTFSDFPKGVKLGDGVDLYKESGSYKAISSSEVPKQCWSVTLNDQDQLVFTGETKDIYFDSEDAAKAFVEASGKGYEVKEVDNRVDLASATVTLEPDTYTYDGAEKQPEATVTLDDKTLTKGQDYTVSYESNVDAGTAAAKIEGINDYKGSVSKEFTISQLSINGAKVTLGAALTYNGSEQTQEISSVELKIGEKDVNVLDSLDVEGNKATNAGDNYKIILTAKENSNFAGSVTCDYSIAKAAAGIQVKDPGSKTVGDPAFKLDAKVSTDAALEYASSDKSVATVDENGLVTVFAAGTTTLTVSAKENSNYQQGEASVELKVEAAPTPAVTDISAAKVTLSKTSFTYNGKAQKPSVKSVVFNGKTLKAGTDYTASVASGKKVGTYKVTIAAKGIYTGKTTSSFVINPKGVTKFKVSKAKKSFKAKWAKNKTERSGVQLKYSTKKSMANAKTVKAKGASAKAKTVKKLKKKTKYYVQARTYKVVNGKTYYSAWSAKKAVKTK
ncbi:MAG: Ig-like domain-containing protein [Coriobacteriia bacterium]|nr:Ig-like domain-containing protein [Coriobacteriia bacterium]